MKSCNDIDFVRAINDLPLYEMDQKVRMLRELRETCTLPLLLCNGRVIYEDMVSVWFDYEKLLEKCIVPEIKLQESISYLLGETPDY